MTKFTYNLPIQSREHADFCMEEAARRYDGIVITDEHGMFLVLDESGLTHTDDVLRELSHWWMRNEIAPLVPGPDDHIH